MASLRFGLLFSLASVLGLGCANPGSESSGATGTGSGGKLTVFAAASLTEAFTDLAKEFEKQHPNVKVRLNFAGSQSLRTQIENGAPADVFASANQKHMEALGDHGLAASSFDFAANEMVIVVPASNPAGIRKLEDLPKAKRLVLAESSVPAGGYAEAVIELAGGELGGSFEPRVMKRVVSREMHVRQTLQKVVLGEADAAMVYATDAASAGEKVISIPIPRELNVRAAYPISAIKGAPKPGLAKRFVDFVRSESGQQTLEGYGFRRAGQKTASR